MIILLHSSKTMRQPVGHTDHNQTPSLKSETLTLDNYLKSLSVKELQDFMKISEDMAIKTYKVIKNFQTNSPTLPAIDAFLGDIYSGLQSQSFTSKDREFANNHLFILSGFYGVLRALDNIQPYRLEMGYKLPGGLHGSTRPSVNSLYEFWGDKIASQLPEGQDIVNLSAVEYTKAVFPHLKDINSPGRTNIISPKFLTISPKNNQPTFVTVHAKIARGTFARWLIQNRINDVEELKNFNEIGYKYSPGLSAENEPVFIAKEFKGLGLSVRQKKAA